MHSFDREAGSEPGAERAMKASAHAVKNVAFFVYPVRDMVRSREFYEGILGLKLSSDYEGHWVEYNIQGVTLALTDWLGDAQPHAYGAALALEVAHADSLFEFLALNRVSIIKPLCDTPLFRMGIVADPDGNGIMIHQAKVIQ